MALFQDARTGFSHLLPGRPSLGMPRPGAPAADATVYLQDAPVAVRYKLDPPAIRASSSADLVRLTAEVFACWRARAATRIDLANPSWLIAWGADAAAVASYDVSPIPGAEEPSHEDLFVLYRDGMTYQVTWTYPPGLAEDAAFASFASVAEATMVWDPLRWEQRGLVWPDSPIACAGIHARATPKYEECARWLGDAPLADDERASALCLLADIAGNAGAPWVELPPDSLERARIAITSAFRSQQLQAFVRSAFLEVKTAHDLRGLAVLLGRAIEPTSRPSHIRKT